MAGDDPEVALTGAFNFRDLGGLATVDGRQTRWGRLFRSDSLHSLTPSDTDLLTARGLATVVDLRTPSEVTRLGRGPMGVPPLRYVNTTVTQHGASDQPLSQRYLAYLDDGAAGFTTAISAMVETLPSPLVFCCFFGKDRTGVLAALVLDALGVRRNEIVRDYAASAPGMAALLQHMRQDSVYAETIDLTPPHVLSATAETMSDFLGALDRQHGGGRSWMLAAGITPAQLQHLSDQLLA